MPRATITLHCGLSLQKKNQFSFGICIDIVVLWCHSNGKFELYKKTGCFCLYFSKPVFNLYANIWDGTQIHIFDCLTQESRKKHHRKWFFSLSIFSYFAFMWVCLDHCKYGTLVLSYMWWLSNKQQSAYRKFGVWRHWMMVMNNTPYTIRAYQCLLDRETLDCYRYICVPLCFTLGLWHLFYLYIWYNFILRRFLLTSFKIL